MVPKKGKSNIGDRNICQCKLIFFSNQMVYLAGVGICLCDCDTTQFTVQELVNIQEIFSNDNKNNEDTGILILNGHILRLVCNKNDSLYLPISL